jgi:RimJ/RimL family protein N-acetyltransferase
VTLAGHGVVLRAFTPSDLPAVRAAFADPEIARWNPGPGPDDAAVAVWMQRRNDWIAGDHASWAVGDEAGELLGSVSIHRIDTEQGDAEVGYWIAPPARGHGYAALALSVATAWAFRTRGLRRLYLYHAVPNAASCKVAARAGYLLEGTLRQSYRYPHGEIHDEHLHARLATDPAPPL